MNCRSISVAVFLGSVYNAIVMVTTLNANNKSVNYELDTTIKDIQVLDGRIFLNIRGVEKYDCFVACAVRTDCVTIGLFDRTGQCDLYRYGMSEYQSGIKQQNGTTMYRVACTANKDYTRVRRLGLCVRIITATKNYDDAQRTCAEEEARLISLESKEIFQYLTRVLPHLHSNDQTYILNAQKTEGQWEWNTTAGPLPFKKKIAASTLQLVTKMPGTQFTNVAITSIGGKLIEVDGTLGHRFVCVMKDL